MGLNITNEDDSLDTSSGTRCYTMACYIEATFLAALSIFITIGNGLNIFILGSRHYPSTIHGYLLISLSIADIGLGPIAATAASSAIHGYRWYGVLVCEVTAFLCELFRCVSLSMLTILSMEKYVAILHPLRYNYTVFVTRRKTVSAILGVWLVLIAMYVVLFVMSQTGTPVPDYYSDTLFVCVPPFENRMGLALTLLIVLLSPSFVIITYTSLRVMIRIAVCTKRRRRLIANYSKRKCSGTLRRMLPSSLRENLQAFRVLLVIAGMVYVTWLPFTVWSVFTVARTDEITTAQAPQFIIFWLTVSNSGCNVLIYCVMDANYRKAFKAILAVSFGIGRVRKVSDTYRLTTQATSCAVSAEHRIKISNPPRYVVGIRDDDGFITSTNVTIDPPPTYPCIVPMYRHSIGQAMNIHRKLDRLPREFPSFYSLPDGNINRGLEMRADVRGPFLR